MGQESVFIRIYQTFLHHRREFRRECVQMEYGIDWEFETVGIKLLALSAPNLNAVNPELIAQLHRHPLVEK